MENHEYKQLCVIVLDISDKMIGKPIRKLNKTLKGFYDEICYDDSSNIRFEISLITFNEKVNTIQEPALVEDFTIPRLKAGGGNAMVEAVREAIEKVQAWKEHYKSKGQAYYCPWIILMTAGEPDSGQDIIELANQIKTDLSFRRYEFLPILMGDGNLDTIKTIKDNMCVNGVSMSRIRFVEFFRFIEDSDDISSNVDKIECEDWISYFLDLDDKTMEEQLATEDVDVYGSKNTNELPFLEKEENGVRIYYTEFKL